MTLQPSSKDKNNDYLAKKDVLQIGVLAFLIYWCVKLSKVVLGQQTGVYIDYPPVVVATVAILVCVTAVYAGKVAGELWQ